MGKDYQKKKKDFTHTAKLDGTEREGLVTLHFGVSCDVIDDNGNVIRCHLRKNMAPCITGDRVLFREDHLQQGVVVAVLPRRSLLAKPEKNGRLKLFAANIDQLIIVMAPPPLFSFYLLDRYLVAAAHLNIPPIILFHKTDLLDAKHYAEMQTLLNTYEILNYPLIFSSIISPHGLDGLIAKLKNKSSVLVGLSGVGKSSIISQLIGNPDIMIGKTAALSGLGKHTTTTTHLYPLPMGGNIIDSPGVREFSLNHLTRTEILEGFTEFKPYLGQCKFRNCQHQAEPDCAIQEAIKAGKISLSRFESFCEICL